MGADVAQELWVCADTRNSVGQNALSVYCFNASNFIKFLHLFYILRTARRQREEAEGIQRKAEAEMKKKMEDIQNKLALAEEEKKQLQEMLKEQIKELKNVTSDIRKKKCFACIDVRRYFNLT